MLITLFSAKGSPGVTSTALAVAFAWPRPCVLIEADPSGGDIALRCRAEAGGTLTQSPNVLGLATAVRGGRTTEISLWAQQLANGTSVIPGVSSASQASGIGLLWHGVAEAARTHTRDVIADVGRIEASDKNRPMLAAADLAVPILSASMESLIHTRELLREATFRANARVVPMLIGPVRSAAADSNDVDEVLADAGIAADPTLHVPLDHAGLKTIERGASPDGRSRVSALIRAARPLAEQLAAPSLEVSA